MKMKSVSPPRNLVRYAKAFAAASAYAERGICRFRIAAVSSKPNSFGLHGYILVARNGAAYEVARSVGPWNDLWSVGMDVTVPRNINGGPSFVGCEIPRSKGIVPAAILRELYPA